MQSEMIDLCNACWCRFYFILLSISTHGCNNTQLYGTSDASHSDTTEEDTVDDYSEEIETDSLENLIAICPPNNHILVPSHLELEGNGSGGMPPYEFSWDAIELPEYIPIEDYELYTSDTNYIPITIYMAGEYRFSLRVEDTLGDESFCETTINASQEEGLYISLIWNPPDQSCSDISDLPECDPTDADIHLAHLGWATEWFDYADCYYENCLLSSEERWNWDGENQTLFRDDRWGFGPELVFVEYPSSEHGYAVGVHLFRNEIPPYPAFPVVAYISISCNGTIVFSSDGLNFDGLGDFWVVASIDWNDGECEVNPILNDDGSALVMSETSARNRLW
jgi:hypothetical protein